MLQLGIRAHDFSPPKPAAEFLQGLSAAGIEHVQLCLEKSFSDLDVATGHYSIGLAYHMATLLQKNHIHCAVLDGCINPVMPLEILRQKEVARFVERMRYARQIGADLVATGTGRYTVNSVASERTGSRECYRTLLKSFSEICIHAEALSVNVAVEGVFDQTLSTPQKMKQFLDDMSSPNLEVVLDFANLISPAHTDPETQERLVNEAFDLYGDRISVLHLKDCIFDPRGTQKCVRPGTGLIRHQPLMKLVKKNKPYMIGLLEGTGPADFARDCAYFQQQWLQA